mmetsp:Transcript_20872/g.62410  ORF Transcript_20872/g.62410 Transcript_20872/m.62410 type:complete len:99 (+) Transcript_20872:1103-1399(+)
MTAAPQGACCERTTRRDGDGRGADEVTLAIWQVCRTGRDTAAVRGYALAFLLPVIPARLELQESYSKTPWPRSGPTKRSTTRTRGHGRRSEAPVKPNA